MKLKWEYLIPVLGIGLIYIGHKWNSWVPEDKCDCPVNPFQIMGGLVILVYLIYLTIETLDLKNKRNK